MGRFKQYRQLAGTHSNGFATRGIMAFGCLLFMASLGIGMVGSHLVQASPTYSPVDLLGQNSYTTSDNNAQGPNANGLDEPYADAIDSVHHRLFVNDGDNDRVLVYNLDSSDHLIDKTADFVLGEPNFATRDCNPDGVSASNFCEAEDIAYDSGHNRLFVSDPDNNRILVFDTTSITNGEDAVNVLGQTDFQSTNNCGTTPNADCGPGGLAYDAVHDRLFTIDVNSDRIMVFDTASITDGEDAVNVLGQPDLNTNNGCAGPTDSTFCSLERMAYDPTNNRLFVADNDYSRILIFDVSSISDGESAENVLGQADFTSEDCCSATASTIGDVRAMSYDAAGKRLFVSDAGLPSYNRILEFNVDPTLGSAMDGEDADHVLGQADFNSNQENRGGGPDINTLAGPYGNTYDPTTGYLYVADEFNNRIMVFDVNSITDGEDAIDQIGQPDFQSDFEDGVQIPNANGLNVPGKTALDSVHHRLFVIDGQNNRILVFNLDSSNNLIDHTADLVLGQTNLTSNSTNGCFYGDGPTDATTLCFATEGLVGNLSYDSTDNQLYVSDGMTNRVLIYDTSTITDGMAAIAVLGQEDFNSPFCNGDSSPTATTLCQPQGLTVDTIDHHLYVSDEGNSRILVYDLDNNNLPIDGTADAVIGQTDMTSGDCDQGDAPTADDLCAPNGITVDPVNHRLYVADANNFRVLEYNLNSNNLPLDSTADVLIGQTDFTASDCNEDGDASASTLCYPTDVNLDSGNHQLFVIDSENNRVLIYGLTGSNLPIDTDADAVIGQPDMASTDCDPDGDATDHSLCFPYTVSFGPANGDLYVTDSGNNRILIYNIDEVASSDTDNDNISDATEDAAPNGGDANNDGTPDSQQANVTSFVDPVTGNYASLQTNCTDNFNVQLGGESSQDKDAAFSYPAGLFGFNGLTCGAPGVTVTITEYFYGNFNASQFVLREWNPDNGTYTTIPGALLSNVTIGGQAALKAVYQITDGSGFDLDGAKDGNVKDPAGPALNVVGAPNTGEGGAAVSGRLLVN